VLWFVKLIATTSTSMTIDVVGSNIEENTFNVGGLIK
jgi:hypothetical protein